MTDRELMQRALDVLEEINKLSVGENAICLPAEIDGAMDALRERLAQPEQEPFGYFQLDLRLDAWVQNRDSNKGVAFYTAPRQWQGLTDEEILSVARDHYNPHERAEISFARAIEAKLKEKNS